MFSLLISRSLIFLLRIKQGVVVVLNVINMNIINNYFFINDKEMRRRETSFEFWRFPSDFQGNFIRPPQINELLLIVFCFNFSVTHWFSTRERERESEVGKNGSCTSCSAFYVYFLFFVVGQFFWSANLICLFFLWPFGKYLQEVGDTHFSRSDPSFEISQYLKMV